LSIRPARTGGEGKSQRRKECFRDVFFHGGCNCCGVIDTRSAGIIQILLLAK
jgi:hypothetical protein